MEVSNNKQGDDVKFGWDGDGDKDAEVNKKPTER